MVNTNRLIHAYVAVVCLILAPCVANAQAGADQFKIGKALLDSNKADAAIKAFEKAVKADDKNAEYHLWLGRAVGTVAQEASILRQPFLAKRVKAEFERTAELDPTSFGAHDGLMTFYLKAPGIMGGSVAKAREQAEAIAKYHPLRGHFARATVFSDQKDLLGVEREYRAAAAEFPDSLNAVLTYANFLATNGKGNEAFATLDKTLVRKPGDLNVLIWVGRIATITGKQLDRGEQAIRSVLAAPGVGTDNTLPAPAGLHFRLGDVLAKKGQKDAAKKEYEKAIELNPKLEAAKKALKAL